MAHTMDVGASLGSSDEMPNAQFNLNFQQTTVVVFLKHKYILNILWDILILRNYSLLTGHSH